MKTTHGLWFMFNLLLGLGLQLMLAESRRWLGISSFGHPYLLPLVLAPMTLSPVALLVLAGVLGFFVDAFYDTLGVHLSACVATAYICTGIQLRYTPASLREIQIYPRAARMGWRWYLVYLLALLLPHQLLVLLLEAGDWPASWYAWRLLLQGFAISYVFFCALELLRIFFGKTR